MNELKKRIVGFIALNPSAHIGDLCIGLNVPFDRVTLALDSLLREGRLRLGKCGRGRNYVFWYEVVGV